MMEEKIALTAWVNFFSSKTKEECMKAATMDPDVAKAVAIFNNLDLDENAISLTKIEDLKILDLVDQLAYAKETGEEEGRKEAMEELYRKVFETATKKTLIDVAKNMLEINIPIDEIVLCTKLPQEEVYRLVK